MTHQPENSHNNSFPAHYELPEDQLNAEMAFRDAYAAQFPEYMALLNNNLEELQRQAGIEIPLYRGVDRDDEEADADDHYKDAEYVDHSKFFDEETGYFKIGAGPLSPHGLLSLAIEKTMAARGITLEQLDALPRAEQQEVEISRDGFTVVGMPDYTRAMVDGLYALTGATVARDEHEEGVSHGSVIRKGTYMDTTVYFCESFYDSLEWAGNRPTFSLFLLGTESGEDSITAMNMSQLTEFADKSGLSTGSVHTFIAKNNVNKDNYKDVIAVLKAAKTAVDLTAHIDEHGPINP